MRPSRRLLVLCGAALAASLLFLSVSGLPEEPVVFVWSALGLTALIDLARAPGRRGVAVEIDAPAEVFSGEATMVAVAVSREAGALPPIAEARLELDEALGGALGFDMQPLGAATAAGEAALTARQRGVFPISALWLRWFSGLGLWEMTPRFALDRSLRVIPNIRPVASGQIDVQVRSELYGVKDTITRGEGSEFHQLREFTSGMDPRAIDWKHSARMRALVAKEWRAERNHQIILALDNGYLMRGEIGGLPRIDHAINAALTTAWAAGLGGDLVGLYSFDAEPRQYLPPQPARAAFPQLRSRMAAMRYTSVESNHTLALAHLNGQLQRRSLIVIFSDFVDTTTAELLVENIQVLNRAHVVVFVTLKDPDLEARPTAAVADFDGVAEAVVAGEMLRERQLVFDRLARLGVLCVDAAPRELSPRLIATYLQIKAKELI